MFFPVSSPGRLLAAAVCFAFAGSLGLSQETRSDPSELSLTELADTTVTSVAKKAQHLSQVPAAVFVISRDDIKRSGAMYLPEVLRLSPGVQVARINATEWAVSVRGFDGRWSDKLLVLIDGRTVYSPLFSGVYWDEQLLPLEDVERIEVIRGPGATMWGSNAVNGVINIITRSAIDTQGASVSVTGGGLDRVNATAHYGGLIGKNGSYRVYSRFTDRQWDSPAPTVPGNWRDMRGGFRFDWKTTRDTFSVTADAFGATTHDLYLPVTSASRPFATFQDLNNSPGNESLLFHWERKTGESSTIGLQISYEHSAHDEIDLLEKRDTIDTDFEHHIRLGSRNDLLWGGEMKTSADQFTQRENVAYIPSHFRNTTVSGFVQDEITLVPDKLSLVAGTKLERDSFMTTPQPQPGVQLLWTPGETHTFWTSVARAVRAPSRAETGLELALNAFPVPYAGWVTPVLVSNPHFQPEKLTAYEAGYRLQREKFSLDIAAFADRYDQLRSVETLTAPEIPILVAPPPIFPLAFENKQYGSGLGYEISAAYDLSKSVRLLADYSYLQLDLKSLPGSTDISAAATAGEAPKHQGRITSYWNLNSRMSFDNSVYFVDRLPGQALPGYVSVVSHFGLQLRKGVTVNLMADNLLNHKHLEFASTLNNDGRIPQTAGRLVRAGINWQF